jgi:hypothetical protein
MPNWSVLPAGVGVGVALHKGNVPTSNRSDSVYTMRWG